MTTTLNCHLHTRLTRRSFTRSHNTPPSWGLPLSSACRSWSLAFLKSVHSNCFLRCYPPSSRLMPPKIKLLTLFSTSSTLNSRLSSSIYHMHYADARLICPQICFVIRTWISFIIAFFHLDNQIIYFLIFSEISSLFSFILQSSICFLFFSQRKCSAFSHLFSSSSHHGSSGLGPRYLPSTHISFR